MGRLAPTVAAAAIAAAAAATATAAAAATLIIRIGCRRQFGHRVNHFCYARQEYGILVIR